MFGYKVLRLATDSDAAGNAVDIDLLYGAITTDEADIGLATLRPGALGGGGPYTEVACVITVTVTGGCRENVYDRLTTLWALLDQAQRWWRGENVSPVTITAQAAGSSEKALSAIVLRRNDPDAPLGIPPIYEVTTGPKINFAAQGIELRFIRRGQWLDAEVSASGSAANVANVFTVALTDHPVASPYDFTGLFTMTGTQTVPASFLILTRESDLIAITNASAATASGYTTVNDSANNPRGGTNILRYTASTTNEALSGTITLGLGAPGTYLKMALFATIRTNTVGVTWRLRASTRYGSTPVLGIDYVANPRPIFLGIVAAPDTDDTMTVQIGLTSSSAASPTFDIDYLVGVAVDDETTAVVALESASVTGNTNLQVIGRVMTGITPLVRYGSTGVGYTGSNVPLFNYGDEVAGVWMATGGASAASWRLYTGAAVSQITPTVERREGYLVLP